MISTISTSPYIGGQYTQATLESVYNDIRNGACRQEIEKIREYGRSHNDIRKAMATALKKKLPAWCGSIFREDNAGQCNKSYAKLLSMNYLVIDIDHMCPADEVNGESVRLFLKDMEHHDSLIYRSCCMAFLSPSGDGVKLVYRLSKPLEDTAYYKRVYQYMVTEFIRETEMAPDQSCSDPTRGCYYSYDPEIFYAPDRELCLEEIEAHLPATEDIILPTIKIKNNEHEEIFLQCADTLKDVRHYKNFRDLCSAASNEGEAFLSMFYDRLYTACSRNLSPQTKRALYNKDVYIKSFMADHKRVPLQKILDEAEKRGYIVPVIKGGKSSELLFDYTDMRKAVVDWMNDRYVSVNDGADVACLPEKKEKRYFDLMNRASTLESKFNGVRIVRRADKKADLSNLRMKSYDGKGNMKFTEYFDIWWNSQKRRSAKVLTCSPLEKPRAGTLSTWTGYNVDPERVERFTAMEEDGLLCQPVLDFIREVVAQSDENYEFVINWMAEMMQNPTPKKPGVAIILRGGEGIGKGTFSDILIDLIGVEHSILVNDIEGITTFNAIIERKLLITLDEAFFSGDRRTIKRVMTMITGADITVNEKNIRQYVTDNIARFLMLSNDYHIVHMAGDARRYMALDVSDKYRGDFKYWTALRRCMAQGGKESLYNFLMNYEVDHDLFDVRRNVDTTAMLEQKRASFDDFDKYMQGLFYTQRAGDIPLCYEKQTKVSFNYMFKCFEEASGRSRYRIGVDEFRSRAIKFFGQKTLLVEYCKRTTSYSETFIIPPLNELAYTRSLHAGVFRPQRDVLERFFDIKSDKF